MNIKDSQLLDITEAAALLSVSVSTLRRWDATGYLKAIQLAPNSRRKYKKEDLEKFIKNK